MSGCEAGSAFALTKDGLATRFDLDARAHGVATDRGPVPVQLRRRLVYPFRPGGQGAVALI